MTVQKPLSTGYAFEDLKPGMSASTSDLVSEDSIRLFGEASGDFNPVHFDEDYAATTRFKRPIAHGLLTAAHLTRVMGMQLPGPGSIYVGQTLNFRAPVYPGDTVVSTVTVKAKDEERGFVTLSVKAEVDGKVVLDGEAVVMPRRRTS
ncbi:MaoC family dehydratase [Stappia sp. F7233]|uniref:MaoC family dehydratase n=1 Tax=Stappia albiluteola TaxID=2758565 RepID=A0A839AJR1_9HYPH|nr:MaoC family dehydratase [Stappia albiluteola]MBA5779007.1 MaoC family dehydratase [Stappia albiluteola]